MSILHNSGNVFDFIVPKLKRITVKSRISFRDRINIFSKGEKTKEEAGFLNASLKAMGFDKIRPSVKADGSDIILDVVGKDIRKMYRGIKPGLKINDMYIIKIEKKNNKKNIHITAQNKAALFYAIYTFLKTIKINNKKIDTYEYTLVDWSDRPYRDILIQLQWMEQLFEFPQFDFNKWKSYVDLMAELKYNYIYFMQWGCTCHQYPGQEKFEEDWQWQISEDEKSEKSWPILPGFKDCYYQERTWNSGFVFEPWLFPFDKKKIKDSQKYSVMLPNADKIPLKYWDASLKKCVPVKWRPPFIKDKKMFRRVNDYIHSRGIKAGLFTTARCYCIDEEKFFIKFWNYVIDHFVKEGIDSFMFETEEGPASFDHIKNCPSCIKFYGKNPLAYTRMVARQIKVLNKIVRSRKQKAEIGWVVHVPLAGGGGTPAERREWLNNPDNYKKNLSIFQKAAPKDFFIDHVPYPGSYGVKHRFLPKLWFDVFGRDRIRDYVYIGAWGPTRAFRGREALYMATVNRVWNYDHPGRQISAEEVSLLLYNNDKILKVLAEFSLNDYTKTNGYDSKVSHLVWGHWLNFWVKENILEKMYSAMEEGDKDSYLLFPRKVYLKTKKEIASAFKAIRGVRFNNEKLKFICNWDFDRGLQDRIHIMKAVQYALEYLLIYDQVLLKIKKSQRVDKVIDKLIELGVKINNEAAMAFQKEFWPSTSRIGSLYDYYDFAIEIKKRI